VVIRRDKAVVGATRDSSRLAANARARIAARYAAESGVEATIAMINDSVQVLGGGNQLGAFLNALEDRFARGDSVELGDQRFTVAVVDASARLDVNAAPTEHLARLFAHFTDAGRAEALAYRIRQRIEASPSTAAGPQRVARIGHIVRSAAFDEVRDSPDWW
jgi:hypothetical protein